MAARRTFAIITLLLLIGGLGSAIRWWGWTMSTRRERVIPMLPDIKRFRRPAANQPCSKATDCQWPFACTLDRRVEGYRCLTSECDSQLQCQDGFVCRAVPAAGAYVRLCVIAGAAKEGGHCTDFPTSSADGCEGDLLCNLGYCGRRCHPGDPASCPSGMRCRDAADGASCVPACEETGCPPGQECIALSGGPSECGLVVGQNCSQTPCPAGHECQWRRDFARQLVFMWCQKICADTSQCPRGAVCYGGWCSRPCKGLNDACGPQERCMYHPGGDLWTCELDSP